MDSDTLTFLHNVLRSIFLPRFKSPQFTGKMTRSHSTIFSYFYLICWLHAALYCVQLWECGVEQCKDLIKHHQGTFNYQRLAELHVSGWGYLHLSASDSQCICAKSSNHPMWTERFLSEIAATGLTITYSMFRMFGHWIIDCQSSSCNFAQELLWPVPLHSSEPLQYQSPNLYFVQIDDHIAVLQQDTDRAEGRPSVLQSVLLWWIPTLLQSKEGSNHASSLFIVLIYFEYVQCLANGVCARAVHVGQDLCVSRLGVWEVDQFSGTSVHHVPQRPGVAQLHALYLPCALQSLQAVCVVCTYVHTYVHSPTTHSTLQSIIRYSSKTNKLPHATCVSLEIIRESHLSGM